MSFNHTCINEWGNWHMFGTAKMQRRCNRCKFVEERDMVLQDLFQWCRFDTTIAGNWEHAEDMWPDFSIEPQQFDRLLIAQYSYEDYIGDAFVLYLKDSKLYEVNGSHCSCYGLAGQWKPEEASAAELRQRIVKGRLGRGTVSFVTELLDVLDLYDSYLYHAKRAHLVSEDIT